MRVPVELLSPDEFEKFANKIVEVKFRKKIISFGEGPDGGIDGLDDSVNPSIIVQSKRYQPTTTPSSFVTTVTKEIEKLRKTIEDNNFSEEIDYVIVTSVPLNPNARKKIRDLKPEWIKDDNHIIDALLLDDLSRNDEYKEIYKSYNLIDKQLSDIICNFELSNIQLESNYFFDDFNIDYIIETDAIRRAYEYLYAKHIVFLVGQPGVGKTTSSQYLGAIFANHKNKNIEVILRSINDIKKVIEDYSKLFYNTDNTLLVIFDDFLGRNEFDKQDDALINVKKLIGILNNVDNLYVIFNSRTQILNQATKQNVEFSIFFEDIDEKVTIDVSVISETDKAKILRKNFEKSFQLADLSVKEKISNNYKQLREKRVFPEIVRHKNYIPRTIEFLVKESRTVHKDFYKTIMAILDNPERVYHEIFSKMSRDAQMFLYSLTAFNSFPVLFNNVKLLFDNLQKEMLPLESLIETLENSWIKTYYAYETGKRQIDFINPSIFDYIKKILIENNYVKKEICQNTPFLSHLQNLDNNIFEEKVSIDSCYNEYLDKDEFIGNKILFLTKENELTRESTRLFKDLLEKFKGSFFEYNSMFNRLVEKGWKEILESIYYSRNHEIKKIFIDKLLYSKINDIFIQTISIGYDIDQIGEILETVDQILTETYGEGLEQNELIDFAEEETQVNIFQQFTCIVEKYIVEEFSDTFKVEMYLEEYLSENSIDISDYFVYYHEEDVYFEVSILKDNIFKYYLEKYVLNLIPKQFYENLDTGNIIGDINSSLDEAMSNVLSDYLDTRYRDDERYSLHMEYEGEEPEYEGEEPDFDSEINELLDVDLT